MWPHHTITAEGGRAANPGADSKRPGNESQEKRRMHH